MAVKFTKNIAAKVKEQKEQQRQLELSSFYKQRVNSAEQVKVINFFMEVGKNHEKYKV